MSKKSVDPEAPISPEAKRAGEKFARFVQTIAALRNPECGCPWDLEQSHSTLKPYLIEEAYEVLEAIDSDLGSLPSELGDVLLQVVLHAQVAKDNNSFDIEQVVERANRKMVERHPHVFASACADTTKKVLENWEQIKQRERPQGSSILEGIPKALPALLQAQRMGDKASRIGFDWQSAYQVIGKVREEMAELDLELQSPDIKQERIRDELGDVLFAIAQLARKAGLSAEDALKGSCDKFSTRFRWMEQNAEAPLKELNLEQLEALWSRAKEATQD